MKQCLIKGNKKKRNNIKTLLKYIIWSLVIKPIIIFLYTKKTQKRQKLELYKLVAKNQSEDIRKYTISIEKKNLNKVEVSSRQERENITMMEIKEMVLSVNVEIKLLKGQEIFIKCFF